MATSYMKVILSIFFFSIVMLWGIAGQAYAAAIVPVCSIGECSPGSSQIVCCGGTVSEQVCVDCAVKPECIGITGCWSPSTPPCGTGTCSTGGSGPTPTPAPPACGCGGGVTNCCNTTGTDGCQYFGVCSGSTCTVGGQVPGSCPVAPTPTPAGGCVPGSYCFGTNCTGCGTGTDTYCGATGSCNDVRTVSGAFCDSCTYCAPGTGACPTPASGGGPAPTTPPPGATPPPSGGCVPCSAGVCCGGQTCQIGPPATCVGGAPPPIIIPPPPPSCSGCQSWNGVACVDNSALCGIGQICSGGVCINQTFNINGVVFVDANKNGFRDAGESAYITTNPLITLSNGSSTNAISGNYSFNNVNAGTYNVTLTVPSGYLSTSANPASVTGSTGNITQNFGIVQNPPVCSPASLNASPTTVNAGATSSLSVTSCSNTSNPAVPPTNWNPNAGSNPACSSATITNTFSDATSATATWNAPACPASNIVCQVSVGVTGPGGTTTYTQNINVNQAYTATANVLEDGGNNGCVSGSSAYAGSTALTLTNTGTGAFSNQNTVGGTVVFTCQNSGNYNLSLTIPTGYRITNRSVAPGPSSLVLGNGVSFALGPNQTTTFCISKVNPWFQTTSGDVRDVSLTDKVPAGLYASSDAVNPSLFISSNWASDFGNGAASALGWKADAEYDYNKNSQNRNGTANYSYYASKLNQNGISPTALQNCNSSACNLNLATGIYTVNGPITITGYSQVPGAHVVILVNGDVTIKSNIKVPAGVHNLFILAAKGNVTIDRTVGEALFSSSATNVEGVITAEGSVTADGAQCGGGNPDLRLNIAGTVVANALKPFATAGSGVFTNNRSLCANDLTTPVVTFSPRLDFITELTDFYKTINQRWKEVQP